MSNPIANPGGYRKLNTNEQVTSAAWNDLGKQVNNTIFDLLVARLMQDDAGASWDNGFFGSDCIAVKGAGSLDIDISPGLGFFYDATEADDFDPIYKPILVGLGFTQTLAAHDATDPRYDIICLAPATVEDIAASVYVKSGGSVSSSSLNTRAVWSYTIQVVQGTPAASPSVPLTPAGYVKIADCLVPAATGDVTVADTRTVLQMTAALAGPPGPAYHQNWVPGTSTELNCTASSYPDVAVAAGRADIEGRKYTYDAAVVTLPTVDGTYYIFAKASGALGYGDITSYADQDAAEAAESSAVLATFIISTSGGTVTLLDDLRRRAPYLGTMINDGTMAQSKMINPPMFPVITATWLGSNSNVDVSIIVQDEDGNAAIDSGFSYFIDVQFFDGTWTKLTNPPWSLTAVTGDIYVGPSTTGGELLGRTANSSSGPNLVINADYSSTYSGSIAVRARIISQTNGIPVVGGEAWLLTAV